MGDILSSLHVLRVVQSADLRVLARSWPPGLPRDTSKEAALGIKGCQSDLCSGTEVPGYHTRQISPFRYAPSGNVSATGWSGPCVICPMIWASRSESTTAPKTIFWKRS